MPFLGKYKKTYSKKSQPILKYNESLFRHAMEASCFENGLAPPPDDSLESSSAWKDEFDKIIPEKSEINKYGITNNVRATFNRNSSFEDSDDGTNKNEKSLKKVVKRKRTPPYAKFSRSKMVVPKFGSLFVPAPPVQQKKPKNMSPNFKTHMSTPIGKAQHVNMSMLCPISPINDKSNQTCDITVASRKRRSPSPRNLLKEINSDLHLSFIGTPTFSQNNGVGMNSAAESYCKTKGSENENPILNKQNSVDVSRDLFSGCGTSSESSAFNSNSKPDVAEGKEVIPETRLNSIIDITLDATIQTVQPRAHKASSKNHNLSKPPEEIEIPEVIISNSSPTRIQQNIYVTQRALRPSTRKKRELSDKSIVSESSTSSNFITNRRSKRTNLRKTNLEVPIPSKKTSVAFEIEKSVDENMESPIRRKLRPSTRKKLEVSSNESNNSESSTSTNFITNRPARKSNRKPSHENPNPPRKTVVLNAIPENEEFPSITKRLRSIREKRDLSSDESKISESSTSTNFIANRPARKSNRKPSHEVPVLDEKFESRKSKKRSVVFNAILENEEVPSIRRTLRSTRKRLEVSSDESKIAESSTSTNFITNRRSKRSNVRKTNLKVPVQMTEIDKSVDENFKSRKSRKKSVFFNSIPENEKVSDITDNLEQSGAIPNIILKSGKWRRSLALWRASHINEVRESAIHSPSRRKTIVIPIVDLTSDGSLSSGSSMNHQFGQSSLGFEESDDLCNLSALSLLDESKSFINPKTFVKHKSLISSNNEINEEDSEQQKNLRRRRTTAVSKYIDYQPAILARKLDTEQIVLRRCQQSEPLDFNEVYSESVLRNCRKIGEGVYGEVFMNKTVTGEAVVLKIIPIEGQQQINGESQKKFDEILSEIVIAMELSNLKNDNDFMTSGFVDVVNVRCVKGKYPEHLIDLWELYRDNHETENDHPEIFSESQLYIVLELANGGQDLEAFTFSNALQSYSAFVQTAVTLAVAEGKYQFEHRDLHWGNILLAQTEEKTIEFKLNGDVIKIPTHGVKVTIIDYTLSRMIFDGCCLYNDLSNDDELFSANGDYQFDIYRFMKTRLNNNWERHEPYTNVLWLHYVCDKMINGARYRSGKSKKHRSAIDDMMQIRDDLLDYKSSSEYVKNLK